MEPTQTTRDIWLRRRSFFGSAALTVAAVQFGVTGIAQAQTGGSPTASPWSAQHTSFGALKQVDAGLLSIGYAEAGPAVGPAVILLHGWPYDIYSFVDVAPLLATKGYRVVIPYLRGYGTTSFLSSTTMRNAQQSAVGLDIIALMDALKIQKAIVAGFDWGARTADVMAVLWPERCKAIVSVSGYLISSPAGNQTPLPPRVLPHFSISTISPRSSARPGTRNTCMISTSSSGIRRRRSGISTMRPTSARPWPSTIRTMSIW